MKDSLLFFSLPTVRLLCRCRCCVSGSVSLSLALLVIVYVTFNLKCWKSDPAFRCWFDGLDAGLTIWKSIFHYIHVLLLFNVLYVYKWIYLMKLDDEFELNILWERARKHTHAHTHTERDVVFENSWLCVSLREIFFREVFWLNFTHNQSSIYRNQCEGWMLGECSCVTWARSEHVCSLLEKYRQNQVTHTHTLYFRNPEDAWRENIINLHIHATNRQKRVVFSITDAVPVVTHWALNISTIKHLCIEKAEERAAHVLV